MARPDAPDCVTLGLFDSGERQRQMGHASSAMMDRYTHGIDGSVLAAGKQLQAWIDNRRAEVAA